MRTDVPRRPLGADSLRRITLALTISGLAVLTALWSVAPPAAASSHCASQDSAARIRDCRTLIDLKDDLDPNGVLNWSETLGMEHWQGIISSEENGVTTLEIHNTALNGTVPAGLGSLPNLRFLELWKNGLTGSIPAELGNLSNLEELRLDQNALTGSIPTGLGSLSNLRSMSLYFNQLSGGIPSDFGNLNSLGYLSLDRNFLGLQTHPTVGNPAPAAVQNPIPNSLGNLSNLAGLDLGDNRLSGSIPSALGNLPELNILGLEHNEFSGSIPTALGNLSKLNGLSVWDNNLSGSIPSQLGNLSELTFLDLSFNQLTGGIPAGFGRLSKLRALHLQENQLSGSIPSQLGGLTQLQTLYLDTNRLSGSIPTDLGDLAALKYFNLERNELSGAIPSELGGLGNLISLNLNDNGLSQNIPSELSTLSAATYISLSCNLLTGNIPTALGEMQSLQVLLLHGNSLNAPTETELAEFSDLWLFWHSTESSCPRGQPGTSPPSNDDVPPTFEEAELSRGGLSIVLTYDESLDSSNGPATTDFTVKVDGQAVTVSTVTVRIREVRLALATPVTEHQTLTVAYEDPTSGNDEKAIQDRAGNDAADLSETRVTNDSTVVDDVAPTFESVALSSDGNEIILTYDEVLDRESTLRYSDFEVLVEGERRDIYTVSVSDRQVTLELSSPVTQRQSVVVSYFDPTTGDDDNAIQDRSGNDAATLEDQSVKNTATAPDTRAPRFERAAMSSNGLSITLVYDEVLDEQAGPATSNFSVDVDGESAEPLDVAFSGHTVVLTLASEVRELQTVRVSYTDPTSGNDTYAIQDAAGNDAVDLVDHVVTNSSTVLDQVAPRFQSAATSSDGAKIILTFDEILDSANPPITANFQVTVFGERRDVSSVSVSGTTVELTLSETIRTGQTVTVTYNDPTADFDDQKAIQDRAGNDADSLTPQDVTNSSTVADTTPPRFVRAVMSTDGGSIVLTYNEVLDDSNQPATTAFTVTAAGQSAEISSVDVSGRAVAVRLTNTVASGAVVKVTYSDPTSDNDTNAIQDRAGNDAASLNDQAVTNDSSVADVRAPEFVSAVTSTDGTKIILTFDENLDGQNKPGTGDFTVTVQGEHRNVSTVTVSGATVELGLGTAITSQQTVAVIYTDPTAGVNDRNAIQDAAGNDAASLSEQVTNSSTATDTTAPTLVRAETSTDGGQIILTFSEVLDSVFTPSDSHFSVEVDGASVDLSTISGVTVRGRKVVLGLDNAVTAGQSVKVTYTDPSTSDDTYAIQDPAGNDVATIADRTVTNRVGQGPSRPSTPPGSGSSGSTPGTTTTETPQGPLGLTLTVPDEPIEVGQTLSYTVTIANSGSESLTGLTWRDKTSDTAAQSLSDLGSGASVSVSGTFGPMQDVHVPHIIITVATDSDQTDEVVTSKVVQVVAATTQSTESDQLSGQPPTGVRPKVPSSLVLRVVRVQFNVPDVHLAHNIPDLLLTLPDGFETTCNFLTHYENTGGLTRWGHATSEVLEERPGSLTQYYQRGVVDCHEREGDWLMERRLTWDHFGGGIDGSEDLGVEPHLLSEQPGELLGPWGHKVSNYAVDGTYIGFLDFFTALGGVPAFGYPKSDARYDNDPRRQLGIQVATQGFVRQYFQAAVMEYHPNTLSTVMLRLLGDDLRNRRYPNELFKQFVSFGSVPPLRVGQIYVAELVSASPEAAPTVTPPVELTPLPATPARPSTLRLRVDRFEYSEPDVHMGHNIPDLTLLLPDGSESTCNFLTYFESNHGLARWGHPTSEVIEERDAVPTQYFQRGVLDCEERDGEWSVSRRLAWDYVGGGAAGSPDLGVEAHLISDQAGELVGPWNHRVSNYAVGGTFTGFLDFFNALGGADTFGFPKTEARYDDDPRAELGILGASRRVIRQYFQSAVLEHHPSDTFQPVKLRLLGDDVRDRLYPNQTYRAFASFRLSVPLAKGQFFTPERITPPGISSTTFTAPPGPPSATTPFVTPGAPSILRLRVNRVLFSAPDVHLAHNIPDLTLSLANGSEASCNFLSYYESTYGLARWGHAISEVLEERPGKLTLYFQRGVLDCEERDGEWRVERRLAWDYIGGGVDGAPDLGGEPDLLSDQPGELLGPWGHRLSNYAVDGTYIGFLDFFTALGGEATFGLPKTDARYDDDPRAVLRVPDGDPGVIRQYFQAAVLEFHRDDPAQPVKLYLIGDALRDWRYPSYGAFVSFGSFGPLSEGQPYYPVATSNVIRPAG